MDGVVCAASLIEFVSQLCPSFAINGVCCVRDAPATQALPFLPGTFHLFKFFFFFFFWGGGGGGGGDADLIGKLVD